jgi:hypothetical protein
MMFCSHTARSTAQTQNIQRKTKFEEKIEYEYVVVMDVARRLLVDCFFVDLSVG